MPTDRGDLFRTRSARGWKAEIEVLAARRADQPVSPLLYGKFCEHLGTNIYNGMWAQVLRNGGFEPWGFYGDERSIAHRVEGLERRMGVRGLGASRERGVAFPWVPCGQGEVAFSLDKEARNGETAQRVAVRSLPRGGSAGVAQPIFLPVHRQRRYELSVYARSEGDAGEVAASLRRGSPDGPVLADDAFRSPGPEWGRAELSLTVPEEGLEAGEVAFLAFTLSRPGTVWLDLAELFPADHVEGFDPDVVRLWREAALPLLRYPGGNFASGYHWQDGIGPRVERPIRFNAPWKQPEPNHVGTDEFMAFCRAVGCRPHICVNAGDGTAEEAAAWVEYCNGPPESRFGRLRAANGHPQPYAVHFWEVGNELYGSWQIGHCTPEAYAERYERFYRAMKAVDSSIHIIANGQDLRWNEPLVSRKGELVEAVSLHTLIGGGLRDSSDARAAYESLMAYPTAYADVLEALRRQMEPHVARPRIAITELQLFTNRPHLPNNQTVSEALFLASTLHTAIRARGLVELINHTATLNHGGGLRKEREIVYPNPVYFTSRLYATQPGRWPVGIRVASPTVDVPARGGLPAVEKCPYLDAIALAGEKGERLVLLAVNRHPDRALPATLRLRDFPAQEAVRVQTLRGRGPLDRNTWEEPRRVRLEATDRRLEGEPPTFEFPPCSVTALTFTRSP
ncbi:MAG: alpha-L-arabinofuranosidase C-terminal domain-containing protein [Candidatus Brocadiia bacterium]